MRFLDEVPAWVVPAILTVVLGCCVCSPCFGQQNASEVIQSELIDAPESVAVGRLISIKLPADLPFVIDPVPANKLSFIDEETGKRAYLILEAKAPGYRITIDYAVVHPTDEEIEAAPWGDREKFKAWLKSQEGRNDEIYRDEHFVKVGGKPPDPDDDDEDDTDPELTDTEKKVRTWATAVGNKTEVKQIAENYATILASINAGAYNSLGFPEARSKIVSDVFQMNQAISQNNAKWGTFFQSLSEHLRALDEQGELDSVKKIGSVFQEIQTGLEAAL